MIGEYWIFPVVTMKGLENFTNDIVIIIPALNEEQGIGKTLEQIPIRCEIIVVDNGSTDRTAVIARECGATIIKEERRGYGYACLAGLQYLKNKATPPEIVVFLDADGADNPRDLLNLLEVKNSMTKPGMVMGSRLEKMELHAMEPHAIIANKILIRLIRILYRVKLQDMGPFRVIDYKVLMDINMEDTGYGWASEMIVKVLKKGYQIREVPVDYRPRIGKSKISGSFTTSIKAAVWLTIHIFRHALGGRAQ